MIRARDLLLLALLGFISSALGLKVSSGYHIVHNQPQSSFPNYHGFSYLQGSAPYVIGYVFWNISSFMLLCKPLTFRNSLPTSPAPQNPFSSPASPQVSAYGYSFPTAGRVSCAAPPAVCEKTAYRTLDGSCNHLEQPGLGVANSK